MKKLLFLILVLVSTHSLAFDAREVYEQKFADKPTGVYEDSGYLFFVVKQQCLTEKKYSGTEESKEAEIKFYSQLVNEANYRSVSFDPESISFDGQLRKDIFTKIAQKHDAKALISHQLLFDRDSKECIREYVQSAKAEQFEQNKIKIPLTEINKTKTELIVSSLTDENNKLLMSYLNSLGLEHLAEIYGEIEKESVYPFGIKFDDNLSEYEFYCKNDHYCKSEIEIHSTYDFDGVLARVMKNQGVINLYSLNPSEEMSEDFYLKAKYDFDKGQNPDKIISDLTFSINFNPSNPKAWKMLSNIYRATKKEQWALFSAKQYTIQNPTSAESWVYVLKALSATNKTEANKLHSLLVSISNSVELSTWAQKQIKVYQ